MLRRFWTQENKSYRNMQIVFTAITLNFMIPGVSYFVAPAVALQQFRAIGDLLGGGPYPVSEESHVWRVLASGNVFTLGFMVLLLQLDVRRFSPVLPAFVVLKGWSALGYLWVWLFQLRYPVFLAVFVLDSAMVAIVTLLSRRARRSLEGPDATPDERLVPRPMFSKKS